MAPNAPPFGAHPSSLHVFSAVSVAAHLMLPPSTQAFARLSAVFGGTYMLSKPDAQVRACGHLCMRASGCAAYVKSLGPEGLPCLHLRPSYLACVPVHYM